eukprot:6201274-Pleurochrysis_carterae.AAC.3
MNMTVERAYCAAPLARGDTGFLISETIDFCEKANPLFLARPRWMQIATCMSAYGMFPFYALIAIAAITDAWASLRFLLLPFLGAKLNAILFYHLMEFTSDTPPPNLVLYFGVEAPYLLSIGLVFSKLVSGGKAKANHTWKRGKLN